MGNPYAMGFPLPTGANTTKCGGDSSQDDYDKCNNDDGA